MDIFIKNTLSITYNDINKPVTFNGNCIGHIVDVSDDFIKVFVYNYYTAKELVCGTNRTSSIEIIERRIQ